MISHDVIQGSPEWIVLRLGIPTGSNFERIVTPGGKASGAKTQEKYINELLAERITGHDSTDFQSKWMARGQTMEADALAFYELQRDMDTMPVGFMTNDAGTIGASPDRLVGSDGLMEIKCPSPGIHVGYLLKSGSAYEEYRVQVQGQLWIAEREWNDMVSYSPEMPMALTRISRDEAFIKIMKPLIEEFSERLEKMAEQCVANGWLVKDRVKEPAFSKETDLAYAAWQAGTSN